ncbi:MAG TPA: DUF624 domain-containing protein [Firmicutes bacterium]|jgi:uncharacterized membrane protein YesL|nr:MAG: hypothetical protein AA931_12345 [Peptococcaceae bacterium 1109]HHT74235.1 DUF624 domain-containing protein [Bacillota bacterium]
MNLSQCWQVIVQSFKTAYERIGLVMLTNLLWFVVGFAPLLIVMYVPLPPVVTYLGILLTVLTLGASAAAVNYVMVRIINKEDVEFRDFKVGFVKFFWRGAAVAVIALLGALVLFVDLTFSLTHTNRIVQLLSGIWIWALIFWYAVQQFVFPFVVQQDIGIRKALKRSALLVIDNLLGSAFMVVISLVVLALCIILAAPILLFVTCLLALLQNYAYNQLMLKYEQADQEVEAEANA